MLEVFEFKVDEEGMISPLFEENRLIGSNTHHVLEIIGSCDSLIAINEVANYFDCRAAVDYEWKFTRTDYVTDSILLAVIHGNEERGATLWH